MFKDYTLEGIYRYFVNDLQIHKEDAECIVQKIGLLEEKNVDSIVGVLNDSNCFFNDEDIECAMQYILFSLDEEREDEEETIEENDDDYDRAVITFDAIYEKEAISYLPSVDAFDLIVGEESIPVYVTDREVISDDLKEAHYKACFKFERMKSIFINAPEKIQGINNLVFSNIASAKVVAIKNVKISYDNINVTNYESDEILKNIVVENTPCWEDEIQLSFDINFDKPVKSPTSISPGSFEVETEKGIIRFDFLDSFGTSDPDDPTKVHCDLSYLDCETFPESVALLSMDFEIKKIREFFVYLNSTNVNAVSIENICLFNNYNDKKIVVSDKVAKEANIVNCDF